MVIPQGGMFHELLRLLRLHPVAYSITQAVFYLSVFFVIIYYFEAKAGADKTRYFSRNFVVDLLWSLINRGGLYSTFIYGPIMSVLQPRLSVFDLHLSAGLPLPLAWLAFYLLQDFLGYWIHRLQHSVPFLWAFHSVHHSQKRLTFMTSYRNHLVEQLEISFFLFIPLALLGVPREVWLPVYFLTQFQQAIQHAELDWRFGFLYRMFGSPVFHGVHHSSDPAHYNRNFSTVFSCWDFIFGTAVDTRERPKTYGIEGWKVPESLLPQLMAPFRMLFNTWFRKSTPNRIA